MRTGKPMGPGGRLAAFGALAALAGCTSLLGDFVTGGPSPDGGDDAAQNGDTQNAGDGRALEGGGDDANDGQSGGDAGDASDAPDGPPGPLNCGTWVYAAPIVLETLSTGNRRVSGPLSIYTIPVANNPDTVRIVAGKSGPRPFSVYSLDRSPSDAGPAITSLSTSASYFASSMAAVHRSAGAANAFTVVLASTQSTAAVSATYVAYVLQDSLPGAGPVPNPFTVYQLAPTQAPPLSIHILPFQTTVLFTTMEFPASGGTTYNFGAGIATGAAPITTLSPVASSVSLNDFTRSVEMFHSSVDNTVYIHSTNDIQTPGLSAWAVPDTLPADAAAPQKRAVSALNSTIRDISENLANTTVPSANIAYEEQVPNAVNPNNTSKITYYAGAIPNSGATPSLNTWAPTDLPVVKSYANAAIVDAPFAPSGFTMGSRWAKDNIMLIGPGFKVPNMDASNGGLPYGLNLVWEDATGALKSEMNGANRLMPNLGDFSGAAAAPIYLGGMGRPPRWAVVWVETKTDDAGSYDVISYNELTCQ